MDEIKELREEIAKLRERIAVLEAQPRNHSWMNIRLGNPTIGDAPGWWQQGAIGVAQQHQGPFTHGSGVTC